MAPRQATKSKSSDAKGKKKSGNQAAAPKSLPSQKTNQPRPSPRTSFHPASNISGGDTPVVGTKEIVSTVYDWLYYQPDTSTGTICEYSYQIETPAASGASLQSRIRSVAVKCLPPDIHTGSIFPLHTPMMTMHLAVPVSQGGLEGEPIHTFIGQSTTAVHADSRNMMRPLAYWNYEKMFGGGQYLPIIHQGNIQQLFRFQALIATNGNPSETPLTLQIEITLATPVMILYRPLKQTGYVQTWDEQVKAWSDDLSPVQIQVKGIQNRL